MEPWGSLQCSQESATGPYPEPNESSLHNLHYILKIHLNIILPSTPMSYKSPLPLCFSDPNCARISHLSDVSYIPCPSHPPWFDNRNNLMFGEE
jgi:hypothetical protein